MNLRKQFVVLVSFIGGSSLALSEVLLERRCIEHSSGLAESFLKFKIGLLLNSLRVLQTLNELHLEFLHLSDLIHLNVAHMLFFITPVIVLLACHHHLSAVLLLDLQAGETLRLKTNLVLHLILLLYAEIVLSLLLLVLLLDHLGLLGLFLLLQEKSILHLLLVVVTLSRQHVVVLTLHSLVLVLHLDVEDFL